MSAGTFLHEDVLDSTVVTILSRCVQALYLEEFWVVYAAAYRTLRTDRAAKSSPTFVKFCDNRLVCHLQISARLASRQHNVSIQVVACVSVAATLKLFRVESSRRLETMMSKLICLALRSGLWVYNWCWSRDIYANRNRRFRFTYISLDDLAMFRPHLVYGTLTAIDGINLLLQDLLRLILLIP